MSAKKGSTTNVYVELLDEGTFVMRPAKARHLSGNTFEILHTPEYDPETEAWKFKPGETVECVREGRGEEQRLVAIRLAEVTAHSSRGSRRVQKIVAD